MAKRYDPKTVHETWERFDDRLRRRWASRHGLLTPALRREMSWPEITTGRVRGVNAFQLDREVLRLGLTILAEHPRATASCWTWRCVAILTFPLGLAVYPPDTPSALPLASLWPEAPLWIRRLLAAAMAAPFVILTFLAARRAIGLARSGRIAIAATCALPVLALLVATSPQVDPRFRVPMIPLLLLLAAARRSEPIAEATATSTGVPPSLDGQA